MKFKSIKIITNNDEISYLIVKSNKETGEVLIRLLSEQEVQENGPIIDGCFVERLTSDKTIKIIP